jgi:hypothetical protein
MMRLMLGPRMMQSDWSFVHHSLIGLWNGGIGQLMGNKCFEIDICGIVSETTASYFVIESGGFKVKIGPPGRKPSQYLHLILWI